LGFLTEQRSTSFSLKKTAKILQEEKCSPINLSAEPISSECHLKGEKSEVSIAGTICPPKKGFYSNSGV